MVFTDARNGFKKDHLHCRWSFLYLKMGFQKTTFIAAGLFQASKKTTSIATGLCGANKWIPQRPPLLLLVFFKPVNGHLKDHRSRVGKHPAAASGGTGPRRETHPALVLKPLGRLPDGPNRGHAGRTRGHLRGRGTCPRLPRAGTYDMVGCGGGRGQKKVRITPPYSPPYVPRQLFFHVSKNTLVLWKNSHFFLLIYERFFNYFSNLEEMEK